jgi:hypothetical protein
MPREVGVCLFLLLRLLLRFLLGGRCLDGRGGLRVDTELRVAGKLRHGGSGSPQQRKGACPGPGGTTARLCGSARLLGGAMEAPTPTCAMAEPRPRMLQPQTNGSWITRIPNAAL